MNKDTVILLFLFGCLFVGWGGRGLYESQRENDRETIKEEVVVTEKVFVPTEIIKFVEVPGPTKYIYVPEVKSPNIVTRDMVIEAPPVSTGWIDPKSIPEPLVWARVEGMTVYFHLTTHHNVKPYQITGWGERDMHKLHSYLHAGGRI